MAVQDVRINWITDTSDLAKATALLKEAAEQAGISEENVSSYNKALQNQVRQLEKVSQQLDKQRQSAKRLEAQLLETSDPKKQKALQRELTQTNAKIQELGRSAKKLKDSFDKSFDGIEKRAKRTGSGVKDSILQGIGVGAGVSVLDGISNAIGKVFEEIDKTVEASSKFQSNLQSLSAITGAEGAQLEFLSNAAKNYTREIERADGSTVKISGSAAEAAKNFEVLGSQAPDLLKSSEALAGVAENALVLEKASPGLGAEGSISALSATLNGFELISQNANETVRNSTVIINQLAEGSKVGAEGIGLLTDGLNEASGIANSLNISSAETIASLEALAKNEALKGSRGGIATRNIFTILGSGADETNPRIVGLQQALENLAPIQDNIAELTKRFGRENATAAQLLIKSRDTVADYTRSIERAGNATGSSGTAFQQAAKNADTYANSQENAANATERVRIEIGSKLLGALTDSNNGFANLLNTVADYLETPLSEKIVEQKSEFSLLSTQLLQNQGRLDELSSSANLNADEQAELNVRVEKQSQLVEQLNAQHGNLIGTLDSETLTYSDLEKAIARVNESFERQINLAINRERIELLQEEIRTLEESQNRAIKLAAQDKISGDAATAGIQRRARQIAKLQEEIERLTNTYDDLGLARAAGTAAAPVGFADGQGPGELLSLSPEDTQQIENAAAKTENLGKKQDAAAKAAARLAAEQAKLRAQLAELAQTADSLGVGALGFLDDSESLQSLENGIVDFQANLNELELQPRIDAHQIDAAKKELENIQAQIKGLQALEKVVIGLEVQNAGGEETEQGLNLLRAQELQALSQKLNIRTEITREIIDSGGSEFEQVLAEAGLNAEGQAVVRNAFVQLNAAFDLKIEQLDTARIQSAIENEQERITALVEQANRAFEQKQLDITTSQNEQLSALIQQFDAGLLAYEAYEQEVKKLDDSIAQKRLANSAELLQAIITANEAELQAAQNRVNQLLAIENRSAEQEKQLEASRANLFGINQEILQSKQALEDAKLNITQDRINKETEAEREASDERERLQQSVFSSVGTGLQALTQLTESRYQAELAAAEGNDEKIKQIEQAAFRRRKSIAIADTLIKGAESIITITQDETLPTLAKVVLIAAQVALNLAQLSTIRSQNPSFFRGGYTGEAPIGTRRDHTGGKPVGIVHSNEYVMPEKMLRDPRISKMISIIEAGRKSGNYDRILSDIGKSRELRTFIGPEGSVIQVHKPLPVMQVRTERINNVTREIHIRSEVQKSTGKEQIDYQRLGKEVANEIYKMQYREGSVLHDLLKETRMSNTNKEKLLIDIANGNAGKD